MNAIHRSGTHQVLPVDKGKEKAHSHRDAKLVSGRSLKDFTVMSITISQNNVNAPAPTYAQLQAIIETQKLSIEAERQRNALLENELRWERELFYNPTLDPTDKIIVWQRTPITIKRGLPYDFDAPKQRVPFNSESERIGISSGTYSLRYKRLATDVGMFDISSKREEINGNSVPCVYAVPTQVLVTPTMIDAPKKLGATGATHGGKRVKRCKCGSANLMEKRQIFCADCGSIYSEPTIHPLNAPAISENTTPQDDVWSSAPTPAISENTTLPHRNLTDKVTAYTGGSPLSPSVQFTTIPVELKARDQWVCWRYGTAAPKTGKRKKLPYNARVEANNALASSSDPASWTSFEQVQRLYKASQQWKIAYDGIGYVFTEDDPFVGLDWDNCIDKVSHEWTNETARDQQRSINSYTEISPSGTGVKTIARASIPRSVKLDAIEMYDHARFFTITGNHLPGSPTGIESRQSETDKLFAEVAPARTAAPETPCVSASLAPCQFSASQVLDKARNGKNAGRFKRLWNGDIAAYMYGSQSEADLALCNELAYWSDNDAEMIDHLFRDSGLFRAEKWDRNVGNDESYGTRTINRAIAYVQAKKRNTPSNL